MHDPVIPWKGGAGPSFATCYATWRDGAEHHHCQAPAEHNWADPDRRGSFHRCVCGAVCPAPLGRAAPEPGASLFRLGRRVAG